MCACFKCLWLSKLVLYITPTPNSKFHNTLPILHKAKNTKCCTYFHFLALTILLPRGYFPHYSLILSPFPSPINLQLLLFPARHSTHLHSRQFSQWVMVPLYHSIISTREKGTCNFLLTNLVYASLFINCYFYFFLLWWSWKL